MKADDFHKTFTRVPPEFRLLWMTKYLFGLGAKDLAKLRVGQLQQMVRRRLTGEMRSAAMLVVVESGKPSESYIVVSRNYGGRYPVSRTSLWRWFKEFEGVKKALARLAGITPNVRGPFQALNYLFPRFWEKFATFARDIANIGQPPSGPELEWVSI